MLVEAGDLGGEMTTLINRPKTALVVIDVQKGVVEHAYQRDLVVENIRSLVGKARAAGTAVVWVQHCDEDGLRAGSPEWEYVPELARQPDEPLVHKSYADSFEQTDLEQTLRSLAVGHLVVVGAQTDECIRSTLHGAIVRGYDATLVEDAHTTEDLSEYGAPPPEKVIAHTNLYWSGHRAPGRTAGTVSTAEATF